MIGRWRRDLIPIAAYDKCSCREDAELVNSVGRNPCIYLVTYLTLQVDLVSLGCAKPQLLQNQFS